MMNDVFQPYHRLCPFTRWVGLALSISLSTVFGVHFMIKAIFPSRSIDVIVAAKMFSVLCLTQ